MKNEILKFAEPALNDKQPESSKSEYSGDDDKVKDRVESTLHILTHVQRLTALLRWLITNDDKVDDVRLQAYRTEFREIILHFMAQSRGEAENIAAVSRKMKLVMTVATSILKDDQFLHP